MSRIHNISWLIVLLLISCAFAAETKNDDKGSYISFEGSRQPSRLIMFEASSFVDRGFLGGGPFRKETYSSSNDENLLYTVSLFRSRSVRPAPVKDIGSTTRPLEPSYNFIIYLIKIPSSTDSEEIRQKYLDLARNDFETKLQNYQNKYEKDIQTRLKESQAKLAQLEKERPQLQQRKAEAAAAIRKNQFNTEILAYLYKEKIKLELDQLEQRAKLEAISKYLDKAAAIQTWMQEISKEIRSLEDERANANSDSQVADIQRRLERAQEKQSSIRKSMNNPDNTAPKEQFADIKIVQIATEKRYQEVGKLITQYEQSEKNIADVAKIDSQLEELGKTKNDKLDRIESYERNLEDIKAHPVRVINKADYDAAQSKNAEKDGNAKLSEKAQKEE